MTEWASNGRVKVERAKEHVQDLATEIAAFLKTSPYESVTEDNAETGQTVTRIRVRAQPPLRFGAIAGDAIHNFRSALDHLWRNIWYPGGGGLDDFGCEFPIMPSAEKLKARFGSVVKGPKKRAVDLVKTFNPYETGNDLLWRLRVADDVDKHRGVIPAYATIGVTSFDFGATLRQAAADRPDLAWVGDIPSMRVGLKWADPLCPVTDGAEVYRFPTREKAMHMAMNPQVRLEIAFGEAGILKGEPILSTLNGFAGEVDRVVMAFINAGLLR